MTDKIKVVELRPKLDCNDIAKCLRNIADEIESGEYDFDPTMAVLVVGRESSKQDRDGMIMGYNWMTHGLGKLGYFSGKGLLACAVRDFCGEGSDG